jgi:hypothetical protein
MRARTWIVQLALLLLPGCGDMLTETPASFIGPENFYRTPSDAEAAVNGVYESLLDEWSFRNFLWLSLDTGSDVARVGPEVGQVDNRLTGTLAYSSEATRITRPWTQFYKAITRANDVVDRVPPIAMSPERKATILGEAKFLRALAYFYLVRLYGDVPLVTRADDPGTDVPRAPKDAVFQQIIRDAQEAAQVLPVTWDGKNVGRATEGAALVLLADVHLTRQEWQQAADYAKQVMDLKAYSLVADYIDAFLPSEKHGPEDIFSLQATGDPQLGTSFVRTYYPRELGVGRGGGFAVAQPTRHHYDGYIPGDYRRDVTYFTQGTNVEGTTATFYPHVHKYRPSQTTAIDLGDVNIPIYRYAEVLLIYAEALNELDRPGEAVQYLNMIRARARNADGAPRAEPADYAGPQDKDAVREAVFQERKWELAHEGKRWFDLVRRGEQYFIEHLRLDPEATNLEPTDLLWPIPQSEIDLNPALTQNPGY